MIVEVFNAAQYAMIVPPGEMEETVRLYYEEVEDACINKLIKVIKNE